MNNNTFASIIIDNRFIANAQLNADDLGTLSAWEEYRKVCDVLAISAWNSLHSKDNGQIMGAALAGLFDFFGVDAKATVPMQKRFTLACVQVKREQSVAMKKARKALAEAKKTQQKGTIISVKEWSETDLLNKISWTNMLKGATDNRLSEEELADLKAKVEALDAKYEPKEVEVAPEILQDAVDKAQAEVDRLASEPMNVWYNKVPMLTSDRKHASPKCRKLIEDTIADIIAERELMTAEELQAEALTLKAERKARQQMKAQKTESK